MPPTLTAEADQLQTVTAGDYDGDSKSDAEDTDDDEDKWIDGDDGYDVYKGLFVKPKAHSPSLCWSKAISPWNRQAGCYRKGLSEESD